MGILTPDPGLVFWTTLSFVILLLILRKVAWKPILRALKVREEYIEFSLRDAAQAKMEIARIGERQKEIVEEGRRQRDDIIREARDLKDGIIREAKEAAQKEAVRIIQQTHEQMEREKKEAILGIQQQISELSLEIASKILREELSSDIRQKSVIKQHLQDFTFN
ncbi:MAG: F0F1 ATP synthase subunit B [Cytophagaceae bacterium]|jgi:F-type H+-transporting ATPase subunit b|nr:F0F1 ATP synthase subunit B [Cytophagaceae bacterium]